MSLNLDIHLGDLIVSAIGLALTWGMRVIVKLAKEATNLIKMTLANDSRLHEVEGVVDTHTDSLVKAGWLKNPRKLKDE